MVPTFSCYPSGTILLGTKATCSKLMRSRIDSISVHYKIYFIHNYTQTLSAFPCGRTQHVRRMRSSIVSMIQSVLEFRFMRVIPNCMAQRSKTERDHTTWCCMLLILSPVQCYHQLLPLQKQTAVVLYMILASHRKFTVHETNRITMCNSSVIHEIVLLCHL